MTTPALSPLELERIRRSVAKRDGKLRELVEDALVAQSAGVVLRLPDWKRMTRDERSAWLAARKILAGETTPAPAPAKAAAPAEDPAADLEEDFDPELRAILDTGNDLVARAREGG